MRKLVVFIVAFLYLASASGATVHMHYCMGELIDSGLWHNSDKSCSNCGMEKSDSADNGCCKDEHKFVKLDKDQKTAEQHVFHLYLLSAVETHVFNVAELKLPSSLTECFPVNNAPPLQSAIPIFIRNCVFRI